MINGVVVRLGDAMVYSCMAVPDIETGVKFKCGKCHRGNIPPVIGEKCSVCGAAVVFVEDGPRAPYFVSSGVSFETPLDAFLAALAAMPSFEREKVMDELRERACILCGTPDPGCPCWESPEVVQA